MKTGLQKLACPHTSSTDADKEGYGLCLDCGAVFPKVLTRHIFDKGLQVVKRNSRHF